MAVFVLDRLKFENYCTFLIKRLLSELQLTGCMSFSVTGIRALRSRVARKSNSMNDNPFHIVIDVTNVRFTIFISKDEHPELRALY